jgi:hypothetical protein
VSEDITFKVADLFGYNKIVSVAERRGENIYLGGYSIQYDRDGVEVSRSPVRWNVLVDCGDAKTAVVLMASTKP